MSTKTTIILVYFLIVNLLALILMGIDKIKAKKNAWRIKEKTLFLFPALGGALGGLIGMYLFRHKTKHWYFGVGFSILFIAWAALLIFLKVKGII